MLKESGVSQSRTETKVYDLEEDVVLVQRPNSSMTIDRGVDFDTEETIQNIEQELAQQSDFSQKRKVFAVLGRRANELRAGKALRKFLFFALLKELQNSESRHEKTVLIALIADHLTRIRIEGDFKTTFIQALVLIFELEKNSEVAIALLEVIATLCKEATIDAETKYELISTMHNRLYHPDFRIKKNALSIIVSLTKNVEADFLVVFESVLDRCIENQNKDLVLVFLQTLSELEFVVFSTKLSKMILDVIQTPIFCFSRESMQYLLLFIERIVLSFSSIHHDLARHIFLFLCKQMRNLHKDIRKKAIDVFCKMELRQVGEDLLTACIQKEKFEDYQSKKKGLPSLGGHIISSPVITPGGGPLGSSQQHALNKKPKIVENHCEKLVSQGEIKSANDNVVIGCIHHVLEDEQPDIRIGAIKALETLGRILTVEKNQDIKELMLYFLNDDFDKVRIKALQSLYNLFGEISFSDFELDTIQFNLKENIYELRVAIYKLLCNFNPKKPVQIVRILQRLTENLRQYREDAPWIYKTMKKIFEKNKRFHLEVLNELIFSDSVNLIQEKDFKDPESIVRIILMSNGLRFTPTLIERYPHYFKKQVILLKETYPNLIYDIDNDESNSVISMKNTIVGDEMVKSFLKCLNEQVRGRENLRLTKSLKNSFEGYSSSPFGFWGSGGHAGGGSSLPGSGGGMLSGSMEGRSLEMFWFCDRLIRKIRKLKLEMSSILPEKRKTVDTLFQIFYTRQSLRISTNLKKFLNLCESFFWVHYIYCKVKSGQLKRKINVGKVSGVVNSLYDSALLLSKDDVTGQYTKLCTFLQPLISNMSHTLLLTSPSLLSAIQNYLQEFNMQEYAFFAEDFMQIVSERAYIHPKMSETEVIEVIPRYPFNFKLYVEAESQTASQSYIVLKEFEETFTLVQINAKNSITSNEDKLAKILVDLDYDIRKRIDGILELKISLMKFLDFRTLGQSRLRGWLDIFRHARSTLHTFPFLPLSNEITLQLKTKY